MEKYEENTITIHYDDKILASAGMSKTELADAARMALSAKLFEEGRVTLGQAAELYGAGKVEFMEEMVKRGYSCVNLTEDEAKDEIRFAHGD